MLLYEAAKLVEARRYVEAHETGAQSLEKLLKRDLQEYMHSKSTYVKMEADKIAEPSTDVGINLLDVLPPPLAAHYSNEAMVLAGGGSDAAQRSVFASLGSRIDGSHEQYVKYLKRPDVRNFWQYMPSNEVKGHAAFRTVMKK